MRLGAATSSVLGSGMSCIGTTASGRRASPLPFPIVCLSVKLSARCYCSVHCLPEMLQQHFVKTHYDLASDRPSPSDTAQMLYKTVLVAGVAVASAGSIELCAARPRPGNCVPGADRRLLPAAGLAPRPAPTVASRTSRDRGARRSRCSGATRRHAALFSPTTTTNPRSPCLRCCLAVFSRGRLLAGQVSAEYDRNENRDFVSEVSLSGDSGKVKYELTSKLRGKTDYTLSTTTADGTTIEAEGAVEVSLHPTPPAAMRTQALSAPGRVRIRSSEDPDPSPAHAHLSRLPRSDPRNAWLPRETHSYTRVLLVFKTHRPLMPLASRPPSQWHHTHSYTRVFLVFSFNQYALTNTY